MIKFVFFLLFTVLMFCGCASSERMARISGGVFGDRSMPEKNRLSLGYHDIPKNMIDRQHLSEIGGVDEPIVNIWPFFFRNENYMSALWPMLDKDRYGFAIRPFFNREGDEYSILFPLSAWNPVNGDGWCLNVYRNKNSFGAFPIFHCGLNSEYWLLYYRTDGERGILPFGYIKDNFKAGHVLLYFWNNSEKGIIPIGFVRNNGKSGMILNTFWNSKTVTVLPLAHFEKDFRTGWILNTFWRDETFTVLPFAHCMKNLSQGWVLNSFWNEKNCTVIPFAHFKNDFSSGWALNSFWGKDFFLFLPCFYESNCFRTVWFLNFFRDKNTTALYPILYNHNNWQEGWILNIGWKKHFFSIVPFYFHNIPKKIYATPLFWKWDKSYGTFPFWRISGHGSTSYVFPLFFMGKNWFASPLFGYGWNDRNETNFASFLYFFYLYRKDCSENTLGKQTRYLPDKKLVSKLKHEVSLYGLLAYKNTNLWLYGRSQKWNESPARMEARLCSLQASKFIDSPKSNLLSGLKKYGVSSVPKNDAEMNSAIRTIRENCEEIQELQYGLLPFYQRCTIGEYNEMRLLLGLLYKYEYNNPKDSEQIAMTPLVFSRKIKGESFDTRLLCGLLYSNKRKSPGNTESSIFSPFVFYRKHETNGIKGKDPFAKRHQTRVLTVFGTDETERSAIKPFAPAGSLFPAQELSFLEQYRNMLRNPAQGTKEIRKLYGHLAGIGTAGKTSALLKDFNRKNTAVETVREKVFFPFLIKKEKICEGKTISDGAAYMMMLFKERNSLKDNLYILPALTTFKSQYFLDAPIYKESEIGVLEKGIRPFHTVQNFIFMRLLYGSVENSYLQWNKKARAKGFLKAFEKFENLLRSPSLINSFSCTANSFRKEKMTLEKWTVQCDETEKDLAPFVKFGKPLREMTWFELAGLRADLMKKFVEVRKTIRRGGFFFYGITRLDGDYDWDVLFFLARGRREGTRENIRVLEWVYRQTCEGARENMLFFPFVSIQKENDSKRVGFLWRVLDFRYEKGHLTGGHILFVPFGKNDIETT